MPLDPALRDALSTLANERSRYWQHWQASPWGRDDEIEQRLAAAWATVNTQTGGEELVAPVAGAPQCDVGAPTPVVVSWNVQTSIAYDRDDHERCLLTFYNVDSALFGGSNDEALHGHRLWDKGLETYAFQEVINSAWIAQRERENSVHTAHRGGWHTRLRHFIYPFHDETFECIAGRFVVDDRDGASPAAVAALAM